MFGLPDFDYLRSNCVLTINDQELLVTKANVLLTFDPKFVRRFGLPYSDYPRSNQISSINGQQKSYISDVLLTPLQTYIHASYFFPMTHSTAEGIKIKAFKEMEENNSDYF